MNIGIDKFEVFDETEEGMELFEAVVRRDLDFDEELEGDMLEIGWVVVDPANRRHGLGLFMIEAADTVFNGAQATCVLKPFPLQFEDCVNHRGPLYRTESYGFATPTMQDSKAGVTLPNASRDAALKVARDKLWEYHGRLGFRAWRDTQYMLRWSGYTSPSLKQAMGERVR